MPRIGWAGARNHRTASELAVVLRSWEDRFGARLLEVGHDDIRLLVSRPPQTLEAAQQIAAEHFAFADEAHADQRVRMAGLRAGVADMGAACDACT